MCIFIYIYIFGYIVGLCWDNGQEKGNYYNGLYKDIRPLGAHIQHAKLALEKHVDQHKTPQAVLADSGRPPAPFVAEQGSRQACL